MGKKRGKKSGGKKEEQTDSQSEKASTDARTCDDSGPSQPKEQTQGAAASGSDAGPHQESKQNKKKQKQKQQEQTPPLSQATPTQVPSSSKSEEGLSRQQQRKKKQKQKYEQGTSSLPGDSSKTNPQQQVQLSPECDTSITEEPFIQARTRKQKQHQQREQQQQQQQPRQQQHPQYKQTPPPQPSVPSTSDLSRGFGRGSREQPVGRGSGGDYRPGLPPAKNAPGDSPSAWGQTSIFRDTLQEQSWPVPQAWGPKKATVSTLPPGFPSLQSTVTASRTMTTAAAAAQIAVTDTAVPRQAIRTPPDMPVSAAYLKEALEKAMAIPQQADDGVSAITKGVYTLRIPLRKNRKCAGTYGKKIEIETNHLSLDLKKLKNNIAIHYDVTLEPNLPKRLLRAAMEEFRKKHYPSRCPAFDGKKNLYSSGPLPFDGEISGEVEVLDDEANRIKMFYISIKYASKVDLQSLIRYMNVGSSLVPPQEAIQAIDIVLRNAPAYRFVQVGRSFFTPPQGHVIQLGDGLEMWYGFFQSAVLGWKPLVNIDVAHKGFPAARSVVHAIMDICKLREIDLKRELTLWQKADFLSYIRGLKVDYMLPNMPSTKRTYKVNAIAESAHELRFQLDDGTYTSVFEYFYTQKKITLRFPSLPCLHVGSLNRPQPIYVPVELCQVTKGQVINKKMNDLQTSTLIKQAATSTEDRKRKIHEALRKVSFNNDPCVKEFGLSVSDRFERVEARILNAPELEYKKINDRNTVLPLNGQWKALPFVSSSRLSSWIILNLNKFTSEENIRNFVSEMQSVGRSLGMNIGVPMRTQSMNPPSKDITELTHFFEDMKTKNVQLVVVVVPDRGDAYAKVKQVSELHVGVLTQCVKGKTMNRMNGATCSNILLKVNSKLNGVNHTLSSRSTPKCLDCPVMIVGADVTHPSPDQTDIPSVAAVSASHDAKAFCYNVQIRLQPPRVEIIEDLEKIMKDQLLFFYRQNNSLKPQRIIFFRDGVSEGQFAQVLNSEVLAIRRACSSLSVSYKPAVTFLVVQKRHHTRFFPSAKDAIGRNCNVPPGTVVDKEITHPTEVDFYLVSHASIQGVSRPTKYRLLWNDDDKMTEDELEELTYYLCHMFSRCTRSVSYPAPTYYAHLAAYRARVYLEGGKVELDCLDKEQKRCTVTDNIIAGHPMFFV